MIFEVRRTLWVWLGVVCATPLSVIICQKALANPFPLEVIERFADARIIVYIQQSDMDEAPAWHPGEGAPPLTIEALVRAIQKWTAGDPALAKATIRKIELKPIRLKNNQGRWYYLAQLSVDTEGQPSMHYVAVLMNGKILPAIREPEPYK